MGLFKGGDPGGGGKTMLFAGGSQTVVGFVHAARQRRRIILIASGVAAVVAAIVAVVVLKYLESQAAAKVVDGYSSLAKCLLGDPPADGEVASVRFRQMQLTSLSQVEMKRAQDKAGPWPDRCAKFAHLLHEGLDSSSIGQKQGKGLLDASQTLGDALDKKEGYWLNMSEAVDKSFDEAKTAGIALQQKPDVPAPPERAAPLTVDALAKEGVITEKSTALGNVHAQPLPESVVRFVVDDAKIGEQKLCTIAADSARCDPLPKPVIDAAKGGVRLLANVDDGAQPLLFAGGGAGGIFRASGDKIDALEALSGWVGADGMAAVLTSDGAGLKVVMSKDKRTVGLPFMTGRYKLNDPKRDVAMLWNHAVFLGADGKDLALATADVGATGVAAMRAIGPLPKAQLPPERGGSTEARVDGCRAAGAIVARARAGRDDFLSFWLNGAWTAPLHATSGGGVLTCHAGEAVLTRVDVGGGETATDAKLTHQRCTPTECQSKSMPIRDVLSGEVGLAPSNPLQAVGLEGKLLIVWVAGQRGGVRMRLSDAGEIAKTPDVILYDDLVQNGHVVDGSTLLDMKVLPAESFAVVLLATPSGVRALRIGADGKFGAMKL